MLKVLVKLGLCLIVPLVTVINVPISVTIVFTQVNYLLAQGDVRIILEIFLRIVDVVMENIEVCLMEPVINLVTINIYYLLRSYWK